MRLRHFNKTESPKHFFVEHSQLCERLDPLFYISDLQRFNKSIYTSCSIRELATSINSGLGAGKNEQSDELDGVIQIRPTNIDNDGFLKFDRNVYLPSCFNGKRICDDDVLFNNTNSQELVGKTAFGKEANGLFFSNHITVISVNKMKIMPEYLWLILNVYQRNKIFYSICTNWNNQSGVGIELLRSLKIPLPPIRTQSEIVDLYKVSTDRKKQKEAEAQELLDGVDDYLLGELGLHRKKNVHKTISGRMFKVEYSNLLESRFDPLFHSGDIYSFVENTKCPFETIKHIRKYMKSGFAAGKNDQTKDENGIIHLRPTNIDTKREFVFERNVYIDRKEIDKRRADLVVKGEVLFNNTNSQELVGKSIVFDLEGDYFCSNHITRIALKEDCCPNYIAAVLNMFQRNKVFFKLCTNWNNQSGIGIDVLDDVIVPVPKLEEQKRISKEILNMRSKAQKLREEAKAGLEKAKQEIEQMILGE